jgi:hypothetical protein
MIENQDYDIKIDPTFMEHVKTLDTIDQPLGSGECMVPGPDGTNQGLGLGGWLLFSTVEYS